MYAPNNRSKYKKQKLTDLKGQTDSSTKIRRDFTFGNGQNNQIKNKLGNRGLEQPINHLDVYRILHQTRVLKKRKITIYEFLNGRWYLLQDRPFPGQATKAQYIYLFVFGSAGSSLLCTGFLQLWRARAILRCGVWASHWGGFSCFGARLQGERASAVVAHSLGSCGMLAQLLHSMWNLPGSGIETMFPALAGGFLSAVPPGKYSVYLSIYYTKYLFQPQ